MMCDLLTKQRAEIAIMRDDRMVPIVHTFDTFGASAVERAIRHGTLIVLDELGRFELQSERFMDAVHRALASEVPVVGVLKLESNEFLNGIRKRSDVTLLAVPPLASDRHRLPSRDLSSDSGCSSC